MDLLLHGLRKGLVERIRAQIADQVPHATVDRIALVQDLRRLVASIAVAVADELRKEGLLEPRETER
jgi:hypothetical protein